MEIEAKDGHRYQAKKVFLCSDPSMLPMEPALHVPFLPAELLFANALFFHIYILLFEYKYF